MAIEWQRRQGVEGAGHIEHPRIGVDIHRQVDRRMPKGRLRRSWGNSARREQRPERVPQGVNVECVAAVIPFRNASDRKITIERLDQLPWHVE